MPTGSTAFLFDLGEIWSFIPVWFGVVVIGDRIETRRFGGATCYDVVGHTDNRGRVSPAAQFGKDGAVRAQPPSHSFTEHLAEVLLIFPVYAVADSFSRIKVPILVDGTASRSNVHETRWRYRVDPDVRRQVSGREKGQPSSNVFLFERKG